MVTKQSNTSEQHRNAVC